MDHSLKSYLQKQDTSQLIAHWYYYFGADTEVEHKIYEIITEILAKRGVFPSIEDVLDC